MLTAALLELMPDPDAVVAELNGLGIPGVEFSKEAMSKCGIGGTHMTVKVHGEEESEEMFHHHHDHGTFEDCKETDENHQDQNHLDHSHAHVHSHESACPVHEEHDHHHDHDHSCEAHEHHHDHDHDHDHEEHHHDHDHDHDHEEHDENCTCGCHDHHHHHHADEVFTSWGKETPRKYTKEELDEILVKLSEETEFGIILRAKGMLPAADGTWLYFDLVPGEYEIRNGAPDYTGRLCVIGSKMDTDKLEKLFKL